jgi:hypothetical protein
MWCIADLDADYLRKMEDVLAVYEKPYHAAEPVVCLDEKPVSLHADLRPPLPARPGKVAKRDNEYKRCGTANVFCAVEPKAGKHFTFPTPDRSAPQLASILNRIIGSYPFARTIHLVMDNLNIHCRNDRPFRRGLGRVSLGPSHRSLHAQARQLAEPGRDRN